MLICKEQNNLVMEDEFLYNGTPFAKKGFRRCIRCGKPSVNPFFCVNLYLLYKGSAHSKKAVCVVLFKDKGGFYDSFEECFEEWGWINCDNILNRTYLKMIFLE